MRPWALVIMLLVLCTATQGHPFTAGALKQVDRRVAYYDLARDPTVFVGKEVILGGAIIMVSSRERGTRLEVAELPLTSADRPDPGFGSTGRFLATTADELDRRVYRPGLLITIIGTVTGRARVIVDEDEESYPLLAVKEMRVWSDYEPPRATARVYEAEPETTYVYDYPPPAYIPYYYPYYPYYPYSPWWFGWGIYFGGDYSGHHHDGHGGHRPPRGAPPPGRPPSGGAPPVRHR